MPKTENQLTLLVCTAGEQPGFVLLYLNASQNCIRLAALPAETAIPFGQGEATLAQCYAAAGPARCREALLEPLALPETTRYLALSPSVLAAIADRYGMLRVGFSGALTADELAQCGLSGGVQALSAREAQSLRHPPAQSPGCRPGGGVGRVFPARSRTAPHDPPCGPPGPQLGAAD